MQKICLFAVLSVFISLSAHALERLPQQGTITGTLLLKNGSPVISAGVLFFNTAVGPPPMPGKYWRVADAKTGTDFNGKFRLNLAAGTYYMGVVKHLSGKWAGPPEEGELFLPSPDAHGVFRQYSVKAGEVTDIGALAEVVPFRRAEHGGKGPITAIEGSITDEMGNPVENAIVFAFTRPEAAAKPIYVSDKSGKDGKFLLRLNEGGAFYLKARSVYGGGKPKPKEIMGLYGTAANPQPVKVETGKITGGIVLGGFIFTERGYKRQQK